MVEESLDETLDDEQCPFDKLLLSYGDKKKGNNCLDSENSVKILCLYLSSNLFMRSCLF